VQNKYKHILFTGGGTGGHIFPALAIAEEIKQMDSNCMISFIGTYNKIEATIVPQNGYAFYPIWISGLQRRVTLKNLLLPFKLVVSFVQVFTLLNKLKPNLVVGTGGYVCGPVLRVASWFKIPTIIHESNSYPGITTRLLAKKASKVYLAFNETKKMLSKNINSEVVGNPTRNKFGKISANAGKKHFGLEQNLKTILIFGGSLGASKINSSIYSIITLIHQKNYQVIWQTGKTDAAYYQSSVKQMNVKILPFIDEMEYAYAAADVVICRSGAITISELTLLGKPAILIPYPHASENHQYFNAKVLTDNNAALLIEEKELEEKLFSSLYDLLSSDSKLKEMAIQSKKLGRPDASKIIAKQLIQQIESNSND